MRIRRSDRNLKSGQEFLDFVLYRMEYAAEPPQTAIRHTVDVWRSTGREADVEPGFLEGWLHQAAMLELREQEGADA